MDNKEEKKGMVNNTAIQTPVRKVQPSEAYYDDANEYDSAINWALNKEKSKDPNIDRVREKFSAFKNRRHRGF